MMGSSILSGAHKRFRAMIDLIETEIVVDFIPESAHYTITATQLHGTFISGTITPVESSTGRRFVYEVFLDEDGVFLQVAQTIATNLNIDKSISLRLCFRDYEARTIMDFLDVLEYILFCVL
ncbi:hypothetical protein ILUMI_10796 [Ignelater luminosus]|uniref:Uncharacterized protein n=1 Tax=Ignelater luminosus TaxID=2038154 RepID=A0A8K0GEK1_IGNLU|nr:hypothetical protein ILUMI_10796 [Ignelater luminosus]